MGPKTERALALQAQYVARNYAPLGVAIERASQDILYDESGKPYFDLVGAYSAVSQGHTHPRILNALIEQAGLVSLTGRFIDNLLLGPYAEKLCLIAKQDKLIPMNTGSEAVDTAIKAARQWGYLVKGIPQDRARIIAAENNFHGRTYGALSLSTTREYKQNFGPMLEGIDWVPFGDHEALETVITPETAAFFVEPGQGEGGIIVAPEKYLARCREICDRNNVLLVADEVQTGLGRTGEWFASWHDGVQPDMFILGKALGGGVYPVSAVVGRAEIMDLFEPGSHGSTFGGNPLACRVAMESLDVLKDENLVERAATLGQIALAELLSISSPRIVAVRGRGLLLGIELNEEARPHSENLLKDGVVTVPTHDTVLRFAPPLVTSEDHLYQALAAIRKELTR